jgi:hypothetical protein
MDGVESQFEAIGNAELVEDVVQVIFHRLFADEELFADFLIAEALRDELHDFFFSIAEQWLFAPRAGFGRFRECLHDLGGHAIVEPDFAGENAMNALHEKIGGGLLQHDATCTEAHCAHNIAIIFRGCEYYNTRGKRVEIHLFKDGETVFVGHAQVKQQNVGLELSKHLDALSTVLRFADDDDIFIGAKEFAQSIAENRVVIRKENTNLLFSFGHLPERNLDSQASTVSWIGLDGQHAPNGTRTLLDGDRTQPQTVKFVTREPTGKTKPFAVVVYY